MSVTDACMAVGCTSLGSFSSRFTEIVGETPSAYRAREHRAVNGDARLRREGAHPAGRATHRAGSEKRPRATAA